MNANEVVRTRAEALMREVFPNHQGPPNVLAHWAVRIVAGSPYLERIVKGLGRRHTRLLKQLITQEQAYRLKAAA